MVTAAVAADITKEDLLYLLRYLTLGAYVLHHNAIADSHMRSQFKEWGEKAKPVLKALKINTRLIDNLNKSLPTRKFTQETPAGEELHDNAWLLRTPLHEKKAKIKGARGIPARWITLLNYLDTYYNSGSDNSYKNIENLVSEIDEPSLTRLMNKTISESANPQHIHDYLDFVKKHMKDKTARSIPAEEKKNLKGAKLEKFKALNTKYNSARRSIRKNIVRSYGKPLMPIKDYVKAVKDMGLQAHDIPKGFDGKIDENGKYYTKDGTAIQGLPVGGEVTMNPEFHPTKNPSVWVAKGKGDYQENETRYYSVDHAHGGREKKKAKSLEAMDVWLPKMQKQWNKDMNSSGLDKILAMMVECLYQTSARPGTNDKAESSGGKTYGLCTWLVKHIRPQANGNLKIVYRPGKSKISKLNTNSNTNVNISHTLKPDTPQAKKLIAFIKDIIKDKKPSDPVWTYNGKRVTSNMLNGYLKELSEGNISPKNFRTFKGTKLFLELLEAKPPKKNITERELKAYHDKVAGKVGELLGHVRTNAEGKRENTPRTAQTSYISPESQINLYRDRGFQPPSFIHKFER